MSKHHHVVVTIFGLKLTKREMHSFTGRLEEGTSFS